MKTLHSQIETLGYNYITDGIYIGTNQCCRTHFDRELSRKGVEADLSLEEERIDQPFGVKFYLWLPVKNYTAPSQEQLKVGANFLEQLSILGTKIYVHCQNGHGRAPTLVAAYLIKKGNSPQEALKIIKEKRPAIHLTSKQGKALEKFYQKQRK